MKSLPVPIFRVPKGDKYLPPHIIKSLIETIDEVRDKTYILYHIETGLRVSEVVNTDIGHIDWENYRTYTYDFKKDTWRWVYWPKKLKPQLKIWLKHRQMQGVKGKLLFPFTAKTAGRILKRWCREIEFRYAEKVTTHWLRHTYIRLSRKAGRDIKAVQQNTGDTINTLLEWYSDLSSDDLRSEMENKPLWRNKE